MSSPTQPVTPRIGYQAPGPFNLNVGDVQPPVPLYIRKDEILRVQINNSQPSVTVSIGFRMMMSDGQVIDSNVDIVPASDRSNVIKAISMEEGYLLSVVATASANPGKRGQTFVQVQQGRGNTSGLITPTALLLSDYVAAGVGACWPGGNIRSATDGAGWLNTVGLTNPAAGANATFTVPTGARWRIVSVQSSLITSAAVGNRLVEPQLKATNGAAVLVGGQFTQTASQSVAYYIMPSLPNYTIDATHVVIGLPTGLFMSAAGNLITFTSGLLAGDQWASLKIDVEEWIEL